MYPAAGYPALPLCANDVQAVKKALIAGLNVSESNIMVKKPLVFVPYFEGIESFEISP